MAMLNKFVAGKEKVLPLYFEQSPAIQAIDELKIQYEAGEYQPKSKELLYALADLKISLVAPLYDRKKIIGVICIGQRKSGNPDGQEDVKIIGIIASQSFPGDKKRRALRGADRPGCPECRALPGSAEFQQDAAAESR